MHLLTRDEAVNEAGTMDLIAKLSNELTFEVE